MGQRFLLPRWYWVSWNHRQARDVLPYQWGCGSWLTAAPVSTQGCSCQGVCRKILRRDRYYLGPWSSPTLPHSHLMHLQLIPQADDSHTAGTLTGKLHLLFHQAYLFYNYWSHQEIPPKTWYWGWAMTNFRSLHLLARMISCSSAGLACRCS